MNIMSESEVASKVDVIVVCIKPVKRNKITNTKSSESIIDEFDINPYDYYALLIAIEYKKKYNARIICLSMGPSSSSNVLRKCLLFGADEAILLNDSIFSGSDTFSTSYILSKAIEKIDVVDFVFFGMKSLDGETGQVGIAVSTWLNAPLITNIKGISYFEKEKHENHMLNPITTVCTFNQFEIPRAITLYEAYKMNNVEILYWNAKSIQVKEEYCGQKGSLTVVKRFNKINQGRKITTISGSINEICNFLIKTLNLRS